jgi:catechol 2,3-dioxygenase-like lactoylglutathione lyase family enzyme
MHAAGSATVARPDEDEWSSTMTSRDMRIDAIDLYAADPEATAEFYQRVFGLAAEREPGPLAFTFADKIVRVHAAGSGNDAITPVKVTAPGAGATGAFTMFTDDVDAACADITSRGVTLINGPTDRWWGIRNACFADPDGVIWELAGGIPEPGAGPDPDARSWDSQDKIIGNIMVFTADVRAVQAYYAGPFGLTLEQEFPDGASFRLPNCTLGLLDHTGAKDLIAPAEVAAPGSGLRFSFRAISDDPDALCAELASRGAQPFRPATDCKTGENVHWLASFRDPAGHIWQIAGKAEELVQS